MSEEMRNVAFKYAVKNAFEHGGNAQAGAVIGKIKALFPDANMKDIGVLASEIVSEVNALDESRIKEHYEMFDEEGWELKQVEKEKTLPELSWLKEGEEIITRVAPNPSGAMHFGHARPAILSDEYVRKYGGKLFVRFDDTDPKIKKPIEGIEKEFLNEFKWLDINVSATTNASNNLKRYYQVIEELLKKGNAYVCFCESEAWRKKVWNSEACPCREKNAKEQLKEFKKMLKHEIKEGEAVVRIKTDLFDKDSSTRDWWIAKVVDEVEHPNKNASKEHVWPSYNLASAIDDHDMKINYIMRGQEHRQNEAKQRYLYDYFGWTYPHTDYFGKISKVGDMILSKSKIKDLMEKEGLERDDDPRLATLKSFRRRGFLPIAIRKVIFELGLNISEAKIGIENFAAINKAELGEVKSLPFIEEGINLEINNVSEGEIDQYGEKIILRNPICKFIVDKNEVKKFKVGDVIRLKNAFNFKIESKSEYDISGQFITYEKSKKPTINWVFESADAKVLMSDGKYKLGISSSNLKNEKGIVNLIGIGNANIENKNDLVELVFSYP
jgi:glutamyl-tRNA synthetase